jgi:hypothetical protein
MSEVRNILTIAPLLAKNFVDLQESIFDTKEYNNFLSQNSEILGLLNKYLIGKLHDSWIINLEKTSDKLRVRLNDFSTHVFADAIVEKFNIDIEHDKLVFPVSIELQGDLKIEFNQVDEKGNLHKTEQISVDEYLGEQVTILSKEQKEIVFELWHSNENDDLPGERILLIASANELKLIEEQEEAWNQIFGNEYDEFYQYFKDQFESDRYVSDYSECLKLVDEFEKIKKPTA